MSVTYDLTSIIQTDKPLVGYLKACGQFLTALLIMHFLIIPPLHAQIGGVHKGDRVKIYAPGVERYQIVGTVSGISSSMIILAAKDSTYFLPNASIKKLAVSKGKKRDVGKNLVIGAAIGGLTGGLTGAVAYSECVPEGIFDCFFAPDSRGEAFLMGAVLGSIPGGLIGLVAGSAKSDQWETVPVQLSLGLSPSGMNSRSLNPKVSLKWSWKSRK